MEVPWPSQHCRITEDLTLGYSPHSSQNRSLSMYLHFLSLRSEPVFTTNETMCDITYFQSFNLGLAKSVEQKIRNGIAIIQ